MNAVFYAVRSFAADANVEEAALDMLAAVVQGTGPVAAVEASGAGGIGDALSALRTQLCSTAARGATIEAACVVLPLRAKRDARVCATSVAAAAAGEA